MQEPVQVAVAEWSRELCVCVCVCVCVCMRVPQPLRDMPICSCVQVFENVVRAFADVYVGVGYLGLACMNVYVCGRVCYVFARTCVRL